jgi:hypothetical protein
MPDDKDDDLYDTVSAMADRLELTGRERTTYIHEHMTRGGYKAVPQYVRGDDDDDDDSGGSSFFGSGRRRRSGGDDRGKRRGQSRSNRDDDDWYSG